MKLETFESDPHVYKREKRRTYKKNDGILCIINQKGGGFKRFHDELEDDVLARSPAS